MRSGVGNDQKVFLIHKKIIKGLIYIQGGSCYFALFSHQKRASESTATTIITEALMYELKEPPVARLGLHAAFLTEAE